MFPLSCLNVILNIFGFYLSQVFAICTDNESKMKRLKELLQEKHPQILVYGCSAHYLNLLEKEVTPHTVVKHTIEIHKYFRNHHQPHGRLKEKGGLMPQIPNDTRWNSQIACASTFIENVHKYMEINTEQEVERNVGTILKNTGLYTEALHLQKQLKEVGVALHKLQSDTATLSSALEIW